jgi:hypothetical protein
VDATTGLILNVGDVTSYTWTAGVQAGDTYSLYIFAISGNNVSAQSNDHGVPARAPPTTTGPSGCTSNHTLSLAHQRTGSKAKFIFNYLAGVNGCTKH